MGKTQDVVSMGTFAHTRKVIRGPDRAMQVPISIRVKWPDVADPSASLVRVASRRPSKRLVFASSFGCRPVSLAFWPSLLDLVLPSLSICVIHHSQT